MFFGHIFNPKVKHETIREFSVLLCFSSIHIPPSCTYNNSSTETAIYEKSEEAGLVMREEFRQ